MMKHSYRLKTMLYLMLFVAGIIVPGCNKSSTEPEPKPNPVGNLLPGASYMGYGYDVFGEYAKAEYLKSPLLEFDSYQTVEVQGNSYNIPSDVQYISVNTADFKSVSGLNSYQFRESLGIKANLGGSFPFFSLSVTNIFNEERK